MYIDEKFKAVKPEETVAKIKRILADLDIVVTEKWHETGIENCWSLHLYGEKGYPHSNGKGITKSFAQASAYAEFIERLQSSLFFYKYQSFECDAEVNLQTYAPDGKYMTVEELVEKGEWMDYIIDSYGKGLTRQSIAEQCAMYAHTDDGNVLTIPFYSVFEKKYVYLPAGFVEHMYTANGCCAGNTREEAWVHALSEIMERQGSVNMLVSGEAFPEIPEEILNRFPTVTKILATIHENEDLDAKVFDCSIGNGFPVVATRIINRETNSYVVNVAADPVLEIAVERSLTEIFQSRNVRNFRASHTGIVLNDINDIRLISNVRNQLERAGGIFTADFFSEEISCKRKCTEFVDNSDMDNHALVRKLLSLYKELGKPVYMRNYNYLGFDCYKIVVPGFSETGALHLSEPIKDYALGEEVAKILRNPKDATIADFNLLFMYRKILSDNVGRLNNFAHLAGLPLPGARGITLLYATLAYASYRLGKLKDAAKFAEFFKKFNEAPIEEKRYFGCVVQYLSLVTAGIDDEKIFIILKKFHRPKYVDQLIENLSKGTPFDPYLLSCDQGKCTNCAYKDCCAYDTIRAMFRKVGPIYQQFTDGQNPDNFIKV